MVLVLVGNIKAKQISGRINAAFGRLAAKPAPERLSLIHIYHISFYQKRKQTSGYMKAFEVLFWISVFIVFYTYIGYGILLLSLIHI